MASNEMEAFLVGALLSKKSVPNWPLKFPFISPPIVLGNSVIFRTTLEFCHVADAVKLVVLLPVCFEIAI
jgi:hypothetical protein